MIALDVSGSAHDTHTCNTSHAMQTHHKHKGKHVTQYRDGGSEVFCHHDGPVNHHLFIGWQPSEKYGRLLTASTDHDLSRGEIVSGRDKHELGSALRLQYSREDMRNYRPALFVACLWLDDHDQGPDWPVNT